MVFYNKPTEVGKEKSEILSDRAQTYLDKPVAELELPVRSQNTLKTAGITTIRELVVYTESELLKFRNFGRKSLNEIKQILAEMGLSLGMKLDE